MLFGIVFNLVLRQAYEGEKSDTLKQTKNKCVNPSGLKRPRRRLDTLTHDSTLYSQQCYMVAFWRNVSEIWKTYV